MRAFFITHVVNSCIEEPSASNDRIENIWAVCYKAFSIEGLISVANLEKLS